MSDSIDTFLLVFAAAFPIVDPIGAAIVFFSMTGRANPQIRRRMALRIALYSFLFLLASLYVGAYVLSFFGISLPVLRVAGGLVVAAAGWKMLHEDDAVPDQPGDATIQAGLSDREYMSKTFYPLTMPLTTGPGTVAVLIALGTGRPARSDLMQEWHFFLGAFVAIVALSLTIFLCFTGASFIRRVLGASGTEVVIRLMAFILICIGVQILWTGVHDLWGILRAG
jgi:multiple antibiotic resistance protein